MRKHAQFLGIGTLKGSDTTTNNVFFTPTLADAFARAGLPYPDVVTRGGFTRFSTNRRNKDTAGWLFLFQDGNGAVFGDWRSGDEYVWQKRNNGAPKLSADELMVFKKQEAKVRRQAEAERDELHRKTAIMLKDEFEGLPVATPDNVYLKRKGIKPHGDIKQGQRGQLVIPDYDDEGCLQSLQYISRDGNKRFAADAKMQGGRFVFGTLVDGEPITLCEGFSTSASVYQSGIGAVVNCFSGSNLANVAADLRKRYPNSFIRVAGDLDAHGKGAEYARTAVVQALPNSDMVLPVFSDGRDHGDFNDLHKFAGLADVRSQLEICDRAGSDLTGLNDVGYANTSPNVRPFNSPALHVADSRDGTSTTRPLTEVGNALRLSDLYGVNLRYVPEVNGWIIWSNGAWQWDTNGAFVRSLSAQLGDLIYAEGVNFDVQQAQLFAKWGRSSQGTRTISNAVTLLSDQNHIRLPLTVIDADPMLIGFDHARQVIDLRTGGTRPSIPTDYITKALSTVTVGNPSKAVRWRQFLEQIFDGDKELIDWLHRWCGYVLTGMTTEQIFLFFFGPGANGKSVFGELLKYVMGDYSRTIPPETFTEKKRQAGGASPELACLVGCRLAMSSETEDGIALNESLIKSLTGGDIISARQLYKGIFEFKPAFKPLILGNHKPIIHGTDYGIWRRVLLIPFLRTFKERERDPKLLDKLKAEAPHILAWMVEGCLEWKQRGLGDVPAIVADQTAEYRQEQDVLGQWLDEYTVTGNSFEAEVSDLYTSYRNCANESGLKPMSKIALGRRLGERGFSKRKSNGNVYWAGIRLVHQR